MRCTIHTHTQHTHNSFYTVIMLQQDLMLVFFFYYQHHVFQNNNHKWVKNCRRQIPSKQEKSLTKWVTILNAIKCTLYSLNHAEMGGKKSQQTSDIFWATTSLRTLGEALAFLSHGAEAAFTEKSSTSL